MSTNVKRLDLKTRSLPSFLFNGRDCSFALHQSAWVQFFINHVAKWWAKYIGETLSSGKRSSLHFPANQQEAPALSLAAPRSCLFPSSILNSSQIMDKNQSFKRSANRRKLTLVNEPKKNSLYHRSGAKLSRTPSKFNWMLKPCIFLFFLFFRKQGAFGKCQIHEASSCFVGSLALHLHLSSQHLSLTPSLPPSLHRFLSY